MWKRHGARWLHEQRRISASRLSKGLIQSWLDACSFICIFHSVSSLVQLSGKQKANLNCRFGTGCTLWFTVSLKQHVIEHLFPILQTILHFITVWCRPYFFFVSNQNSTIWVTRPTDRSDRDSRTRTATTARSDSTNIPPSKLWVSQSRWHAQCESDSERRADL